VNEHRIGIRGAIEYLGKFELSRRERQALKVISDEVERLWRETDARPAPLTEAEARAGLDAAERTYLLVTGWTEVPPQNVMHEPTWTRAGRRHSTHRAQAVSIQRERAASREDIPREVRPASPEAEGGLTGVQSGAGAYLGAFDGQAIHEMPTTQVIIGHLDDHGGVVAPYDADELLPAPEGSEP
jgi:hypothetical protein